MISIVGSLYQASNGPFKAITIIIIIIIIHLFIGTFIISFHVSR